MKKLFYDSAYIRTFEAKVLSCEKGKKGIMEVALDQTAFYPEGGGQPSDTGALNGVKVLHVSEKGEEIIHELEAPLEEGVLAEGVIDWQKRYDNMQQHTGEHIFSGLVHKHFGYDNVGFHMGTDEVTVDFNTGIITDLTQNKEWQAQPFPPFIQNIIDKGGLMASLRRNKRMEKKIGVIRGDGSSPEIVLEALRVLQKN